MQAVEYNDKIVKNFMVAAIFWGFFGMLIGVLLAGQLYWPELNLNSQYFQFGRLRPLHTNAVIFGFVANILMGTSLYIVQRTFRTALISNRLATSLFAGWQTVIVLAAITLPLGYTSAKEYAELEWPIDILMLVLWIMYMVLYFGTLWIRKEKHIFVSNWFYSSFIIVIAIIFIVNNLALPVTFMKSYSVFAGSMDALVQWFWGHNAVGFLLTAGLIGANYYFIPKVVNRPIYSYRLSIIHFWGLIGFYTWAGTHHLVYTSVPVWVQNIGVVMSVILWIPSWVGAYNSYMTLASNKEQLKSDYIALFFLSAVFYYCLATFEGPLLAIRWFNMIAHYSDWVIGHVHSGALGWVGMSIFGACYYLVPKLFGDKALWSKKLLMVHFWLAHAGVALYAISLWVAGIGEGYMWFSQEDNGVLSYSFVEVMYFIEPWMFVRFFSGVLYLGGVLVMIFNLYRTVSRRTEAQVKMASEVS
jgi:cytochrome c oxidase cbb3-type subunit 1